MTNNSNSSRSAIKVSEKTISVIGTVITGDGKLSPNRKGHELVTFFNQFGRNDKYAGGFPSRWDYAEECLRSLNNSPKMRDAILTAVDRRHFLGTEWDAEKAVEHLNQFLDYDGYEIRPSGKKWVLAALTNTVEVTDLEVTNTFIAEQIQKSTAKLETGDFDGAITNSRSLVEAVLVSIEKEIGGAETKYDGNLPALYSRVQKHLNLIPGQEGLANCLRKILTGLTSVVQGLGELRNKMGDYHARQYQPARHHAHLAVNCSRTLAQFLFDTKEYQESQSGEKAKSGEPVGQ
jgi:hypothetical protein